MTMFPIIAFLVCVVFRVAYTQIDCIPDHVGNISLDLNYTLYWEPSINCESVAYIIYIQVENEVQFIYNTEEPFLNVSFLPACERFYFEVRAFSEHHLSDERHLESFIPAPSGADLTIPHFSVIREDETLFLIWSVEEKFAHCSRGFRIVVRDGWEIPRDLYTPYNYYFLDGLVPCGEYEIGVMAIYNEVMEGPISLRSYTHPPAHTNRPILQGVSPGSTYVNISLAVDPYSVNQCDITSILVDGSPNFGNIEFPVQDSRERPPINISVGSLRPDRMYLIDMYVVNSFGRSRNYPIAVQTLP